MDNNNQRPSGRKRKVSGTAGPIQHHGQGLGTGPVGSSGRPQNNAGKQPVQQFRPTASTGRRGSTIKRAGGGGSLIIVLIIAWLLFGRGGNSGSSIPVTVTPAPTAIVTAAPVATPAPTPKPTPAPSAVSGYGISPSTFNNIMSGSTVQQVTSTNMTAADTSVAAGSRAKRTNIMGNGRDVVTIMVYMCGTDLESRSVMGTKDLQEMISSTIADNVHLLVYTGGCARWNNNVVSSSTNQIYEIQTGGLRLVRDNIGALPMTTPSTLTDFIKWCAKNYPANRNELILWDHGGGSVTGYGHDEKFSRNGSMTLAGIDEALKNAGVTFDFIGFDACLMATLETGLMLDNYADYLIASEETEPGIGWYYTNWLKKLSANTSTPTLEIGRNIVDDFVNTCAVQTRGQSATLSVVDLAELAHTVPDHLKNFSTSLTELIKGNQYQAVSTARNGTREFARSTMIDQIDLVHFAKRVGTEEASGLVSAIQKAVKYNRTSSDMSDCYGVSIYFPYRKTANVQKACNTYSAIGMDDSYADCIRAFASLETGGQAASGYGGFSPSILTGGYPSSSAGSEELISALLNSFLGGGGSFYSAGRAVSVEDTVSYIAENSFDPTLLTWTENENGEAVIALPTEQWELIENLEYNLFYDDGEGYIDLGLDSIYEDAFDANGNLLEPADNSWVAINGHPVAYYQEYSVGMDDGMAFYGRVPALLNNKRVDLLIRFDDEGEGAIIGVRPYYTEEETETVAKSLLGVETDNPIDLLNGTSDEAEIDAESTIGLKVGDTIEFIADYYTYDNVYQDSYTFGEKLVVTDVDDFEIWNIDLGEGRLCICYRFTDLYQQHYWTPALYR